MGKEGRRLNAQPHGADEVLGGEAEDRLRLLAVDLVLSLDERIARESTKALGAADEDRLAGGLGEEEGEDDEGEGADPE